MFDDFVVVGEAGNAAEAITLLGTTSPDVVVLDWTLVGSCGKDVLAAGRMLARPPAVLVFSGNISPPVIREALAGGALGFVEKTALVDEMVTALRAVAAGCE